LRDPGLFAESGLNPTYQINAPISATATMAMIVMARFRRPSPAEKDSDRRRVGSEFDPEGSVMAFSWPFDAPLSDGKRRGIILESLRLAVTTA
jgi:hypothetical protein